MYQSKLEIVIDLNHFQDMNINFLIIAWRGFSGNNGKPSEKGLYEDGKSAINWITEKQVDEKAKGKGKKKEDECSERAGPSASPVPPPRKGKKKELKKIKKKV